MAYRPVNDDYTQYIQRDPPALPYMIYQGESLGSRLSEVDDKQNCAIYSISQRSRLVLTAWYCNERDLFPRN